MERNFYFFSLFTGSMVVTVNDNNYMKKKKKRIEPPRETDETHITITELDRTNYFCFAFLV